MKKISTNNLYIYEMETQRGIHKPYSAHTYPVFPCLLTYNRRCHGCHSYIDIHMRNVQISSKNDILFACTCQLLDSFALLIASRRDTSSKLCQGAVFIHFVILYCTKNAENIFGNIILANDAY